jgi:pilus assembly protein Flp/PilA
MATFADLMTRVYVRFKAEESGATGVEYGMLVALIAAVIVGVVTTLGSDVQQAFQKIADTLPVTTTE